MSYDHVLDHNEMVFDAVRNDLYAKALEQRVNADTVVLDLGAGLGPHGFLAADLGARKVYMVDPATIIRTTQDIAKSMPNISCIEGRIEDIQLPEPVDIIVSVLTGNFLVSEDLLPSLIIARDRYLKPDGLLLPGHARMLVAAVNCETFYHEQVNRWNSATRGVSYQALRHYAVNNVYTVGTELAPTLLSATTVLREADLYTVTNLDVDHQVTLKFTATGTCHGILGWFDADLAGHRLATGPNDPRMHWRQVFLPLPEPMTVQAGESMMFHLRRPDFGQWTWTVHYGEQQFTQSSFLAGPNHPDQLLRRSPDYTPRINRRGAAMASVLKALDGSRTIAELQHQLLLDFSDEFRSEREAGEFVRAIVSRYA